MLLMTAVACVYVNAASFVSGGINYNITDKEGLIVAVTSAEPKYSGAVEIPATVTYDGNTYTVKSISDYAFSSCTELESVVVGSNVERVGYRAFAECTSLKEINSKSVSI